MAKRYMLRKVVDELETSIIGGLFSSREVMHLFDGQQPLSAVGDYTDVFVVIGNTTVPWPEMPRISDDEMCDFNHRAVDVVYDALSRYLISQDEERRHDLAILSKIIACYCFRNTTIEDYHAGSCPGDAAALSKAIVRHDGADLAWRDVARLNSSEVSRLLTEGSTRLREVLPHLRDPEFMKAFVVENLDYVRRWDMPSGYYKEDG
jgi:hypothetical protein